MRTLPEDNAAVAVAIVKKKTHRYDRNNNDDKEAEWMIMIMNCCYHLNHLAQRQVYAFLDSFHP